MPPPPPPPRAVTVRPAAAGDAPELARLRYEFRAPLGAPDESEAAFLARCEPWMAARLAEPGGRWRCWVAEDGGPGAAGAVWLQLIEKVPNPAPEPEEHGYVTNLYVRPRARGGTGSALLAAALDWCRARRVHAVILWPTARSRPLYERHGFTTPEELMALVVEGRGDEGMKG